MLGLLLALIFIIVAQPASAGDGGVPRLTDLVQDGARSSEQKRVILIEFASEDCPYCRQLEDEFLKPMLKNREYDEKVLIRAAMLYEGQAIVDFDGTTISADTLADRYGVELTPTMLFLDSRGNQLSEPLVGIWSPDFFGGFIDARIDSARAKLQ